MIAKGRQRRFAALGSGRSRAVQRDRQLPSKRAFRAEEAANVSFEQQLTSTAKADRPQL